VSNNFKDREGEILVAAAHREFADAVNSGQAPYPELRVWHLPDSGIGRADWVDYTGNFMVQSGTFYPGMERVAERLASKKGLGTSHGFLGIKEDMDWLWYRSYETSVLPIEAAANALTSWEVLKEEGMAFSNEERRARLAAVVGEDIAKELETVLDKAGQTAQSAGIEQKSTEAPPAAPDLTALVEGYKSLADAVKAGFDGLDTRITAAVKATVEPISATVAEQQKTLTTLQEQVTQLQKSDDQKMADLLIPRNAPAAGYRATGDPANVPTQEQLKATAAGKDWLDDVLHFIPSNAGR
jgi:uncharacterized coiled-coil protein SlyX